MPTIARGQENTTAIINWFTTVNGTLTDAVEILYQIWDISSGMPGTVIFPVPGDETEWEDVTSAPGRFAPGSYYAYDNSGAGQGWTPSLTEPLGDHRIKWQWKVTGASQYLGGMEDFTVIVEGGGSSVDTYISIQDVRDAGVTVAMASDLQVQTAIETWQQILDRMCRQFFVPKTITMKLDGTDSDALHLPVPIIALEYVKLNSSEDELDTSLYRVYDSRSFPDDRRNPRIKLVSPYERQSIYAAPFGDAGLKFYKGRQNQEIKGVFGFVEEDMSPPAAIQRALLLLVVEKLGIPVVGEDPTIPMPPLLRTVLEEKTDGHSIKYGGANSGFEKRRPGLSGITENQEILDIVKLYRAPLAAGAPAHWSLG